MRPKVNLAWYLVDYKTNVSVFESQDIKSSAEKDTRLRKLRDVMLITLERILDQVGYLLRFHVPLLTFCR